MGSSGCLPSAKHSGGTAPGPSAFPFLPVCRALRRLKAAEPHVYAKSDHGLADVRGGGGHTRPSVSNARGDRAGCAGRRQVAYTLSLFPDPPHQVFQAVPHTTPGCWPGLLLGQPWPWRSSRSRIPSCLGGRRHKEGPLPPTPEAKKRRSPRSDLQGASLPAKTEAQAVTPTLQPVLDSHPELRPTDLAFASSELAGIGTTPEPEPPATASSHSQNSRREEGTPILDRGPPLRFCHLVTPAAMDRVTAPRMPPRLHFVLILAASSSGKWSLSFAFRIIRTRTPFGLTWPPFCICLRLTNFRLPMLCSRSLCPALAYFGLLARSLVPVPAPALECAGLLSLPSQP